MRRVAALLVRAAALWLACAGASVAQDAPPPGDAAPPPAADTPADGPTAAGGAPPADQRIDIIGPRLTVPAGATSGEIDYLSWTRTAARTAAISENGRGSTFALERLRSDLVAWRDRFAAAQNANAGRIATVTAQIAALGPAPADGASENEAIAARRAALITELQRLRAPAILAQESYAEADGLIAEIDALLRARRTQEMMTRGPSPLNPAAWGEGVAALTELFGNLATEARIAATSEVRHARLMAALGPVVLYLLAAFLLLMRGRHWAARLAGLFQARSSRGAGVIAMVVSLGEIALPIAGLVCLQRGLEASGLLGFRSGQIAQDIVRIGLAAVAARWLAGQLFAPGAAPVPPLDLPPDDRAQARRITQQLGWLLALGTLALSMLKAGESPPVTVAMVMLPVQALLSLMLWRLGKIFVRRAGAAGDAATAEGAVPAAPPEVRIRDRAALLLGRLAMAIAVAGPVLSAAGFAKAGEALTYPAIMTLALIGVVLVLQRFAGDLYGLLARIPEGSRQEALAPVLIGFALALLALPVLSLIWGARVEDLSELWTRFQEGYALGETRLSPTDLLTVVVVFAIGYMATRLVQGTLRSAILPKTRIDIGGQNAIVSGVGYIGIFVSALLGITSAGLDLSSLAIVAGALSVGIGFGLQNIVQNFVSGIILLIERPISEGDWIEVGGKMGYVRDISVRSTRIETFDRTDVIVPNADLVSGQVVNWTRGNSVGRVIVPVGVAYGTDTERVTAILREIAEAHPLVLMNPPPSVVLVGFGADSLNFEIRAIIRDVNFGLSVRSELNHAIAKRFVAEKIEIPFPQRDVWIRNPDVLRRRPRASPDAGPAPDAPEAGA